MQELNSIFILFIIART